MYLPPTRLLKTRGLNTCLYTILCAAVEPYHQTKTCLEILVGVIGKKCWTDNCPTEVSIGMTPTILSVPLTETVMLTPHRLSAVRALNNRYRQTNAHTDRQMRLILYSPLLSRQNSSDAPPPSAILIVKTKSCGTVKGGALHYRMGVTLKSLGRTS